MHDANIVIFRVVSFKSGTNFNSFNYKPKLNMRVVHNDAYYTKSVVCYVLSRVRA